MMLNGLEILIERMKTHPEEFVRDGKWTDLLVHVDKHLTEEERQALKQGFTDMARDVFNEVVLKGISGEEMDWEQVNSIRQDYDSVMSYPIEKQKMMMEEEKQRREHQMMMDKMRMEQAFKAQQQHDARGAYGLGAGLMGNQARGLY